MPYALTTHPMTFMAIARTGIVLGGLGQLIVVIAVLGLVWWLFTRYIVPLLPAPAAMIINVIVVVIAIVFLLSWVGII